MKYNVNKKVSFAELRREINKHFLIRIGEGKNSQLVSLTTLCELFDYLHGEHVAEKALRSIAANPTFKLKGTIITFVWR